MRYKSMIARAANADCYVVMAYFYVNNMQPENLIILSCSKLMLIKFKSCKKSNHSIKGHEPKLYEAFGVIAGLFFNFAYVKMKGANKNRLTVKKLSYSGCHQSGVAEQRKTKYSSVVFLPLMNLDAIVVT